MVMAHFCNPFTVKWVLWVRCYTMWQSVFQPGILLAEAKSKKGKSEPRISI